MSSGARVGETWHHVDVANGETEPLGSQNNTRRDRRRPTSRVPFLDAPSSAPSRYRKSCCATPAESAALVVNGDRTRRNGLNLVTLDFRIAKDGGDAAGHSAFEYLGGGAAHNFFWAEGILTAPHVLETARVAANAHIRSFPSRSIFTPPYPRARFRSARRGVSVGRKLSKKSK